MNLCKNNNIFIVNGRYKSSTSGDLTFRDTSVIDYYLSTVSAYMKIVNFEVKSLDSIFSDGHSVLNCSIMIYNTNMNPKQPLPNNNKRPKWNQELQQPFIENIDTSALETEMQSITNMTHIANITQNQMVSLSDLLSQTFINSADIPRTSTPK